jgi:hypothetical protein
MICKKYVPFFCEKEHKEEFIQHLLSLGYEILTVKENEKDVMIATTLSWKSIRGYDKEEKPPPTRWQRIKNFMRWGV